jgi:hypothetical protein
MNDKIDWPSILHLTLSLLAAFACWTFALVFVLGAIMNYASAGVLSDQLVSYCLLAGSTAFGGVLLIPSAFYAMLRLSGRSFTWVGWVEAWFRRLSGPSPVFLLLAVVLAAGYFVAKFPQIAWLVLPFLHVLAVGLPVLWLGRLGWRGLASGSSQRLWGIFGIGLIIGPSLIMVFELAALAGVLLIGVVYASFDPELTRQLMTLNARLQSSAGSPEEMLELVMPYLTRPLVLFTVFTITAGIVPLIEEIFKPIGAWLLVGKNITPWEGFTAGLLSGAGYALFENMLLSTSAGGDWMEIVVARMGTGILHILTSGLSGWALALAWGQGRYLRLGVTYLAAVLIHAAWNSLALLTGAQGFSPAGITTGMDFVQVSQAATIGLGAMALIMLVLLLASNASLRRQASMKDG